MKYNDEATKWSVDYLESHDCNVVAIQIVIETAHSTVTKIKTSGGVFYLKTVPPVLFLEPIIISWLQALGCQEISKVVAKNDSYHCFLTKACGELTLRDIFLKEKVDTYLLRQGIDSYTSIQRKSENYTVELINLGVPDWRLDKFPSLYLELITNTNLLYADGLSKKEIDVLNHAYDFGIEQCERLLKYKIPETINHCDFQDNNMLFSSKTAEINIIDWGETTIGHPFLSLNTCLWNLTYFHNMQPEDKYYQEIKRLCIKPWLGTHNENDLITAFNVAENILGIFAALTYNRLYEATAKMTRTTKTEHPGSIAGCLRSFLNRYEYNT